MDGDHKKSAGVKKIGVMVGGAGLIGGALTHHFKTQTNDHFDILGPNSKKLRAR